MSSLVQLNDQLGPGDGSFSKENNLTEAESSSTEQQVEKLSNLFSFLQKINEERFQRDIANLVKEGNKHSSKAGYLAKIKKLNLSHCDLTAIPEAVGYLSELEELRLMNNKLTDLPSSLIHLGKLRRIELEGNQFSVLPQVVHEIALAKIKNRQYFELYLRENPMLSVPSDIKAVVCSMPHFDSRFDSRYV
ncbi:leucine-rich repeat domain-containing protein [Parachlamydia sp. AcF125]|uniref:leucine-rich repeat domain-containing protein n=1 Tax=Parachlamydia sp. AcF125 TaxID=2795736 RepID=UPI001BC9FDAF|nr:leucine-rich repeat domain-containing protein [Parachlamydia sp. AcF125]MBS4169010.1 hypothetical protein [Parachlamydia sp. AcF125]